MIRYARRTGIRFTKRPAQPIQKQHKENNNMANTQISRRTMQIESDYEVMLDAKEARAEENRIEKGENQK